MSGHSKWAQIKRQKGAADIKRGQAFTKLASAISIAVRQGGGVSDPNQNYRLRLAIEKAREVNMPRDNIERAIERGKGKAGSGEDFEEVVYEGFAPGGVSVIVEAATDNKQRTTAEVKNAFEKNGATLGTPGAVSYQFVQKGLVTVKKNGKASDDLFLLAADSGAEDFEEAGDEVLMYTKPEELKKVQDAVSKEVKVVSAELTRRPVTSVSILDASTAQKVLTFINKLEDLEDVQKVYANYDMPDEMISDSLSL